MTLDEEYDYAATFDLGVYTSLSFVEYLKVPNWWTDPHVSIDVDTLKEGTDSRMEEFKIVFSEESPEPDTPCRSGCIRTWFTLSLITALSVSGFQATANAAIRFSRRSALRKRMPDSLVTT